MDDGDDAYVKTIFLDRVAHELRGPAGVIHGALQELEVVLSQQPGEHEIFLAMAKRGLKRILRTADRLQNAGQLERGALTLTRANTDLAVLVQQTMNDAQVTEGRKKVSVEVQLPTTPALCLLDSHWMGLALFELASNVIRHSHEHAVVAVNEDDAGGFLVSFTDDARTSVEFGPARFQPTKDGRGLGLGLSMVRDVIAAHGGSMHTDYGRTNGQDFGARVSLTIPAA